MDQQTYTIKLDTETAKGTVVIEESPYGLYIYLPQIDPNNPIALIDLFYDSTQATEVGLGDKPPQIALFSPTQGEDPVCQALLKPQGTQITFEPGVERFQDDNQIVYSYPIEDKASDHL